MFHVKQFPPFAFYGEYKNPRRVLYWGQKSFGRCPMDLIRFGSFLAQLRREKGLTQQALGERLGVTNKTVSRWETGVSHS